MVTGKSSSPLLLALLCLSLYLGFGASLARAEDEHAIKLQATLVWGTNEDKSKFPDLSEIDAETKKKLRRTFKWKTYLQINHKEVTITDAKEQEVKMSPKCLIKIENQGKVDDPKGRDLTTIRVQLIGEGKRVIDHAQPIGEGQTLTLAGNDRNDTAWFVLLTRVPAEHK